MKVKDYNPDLATLAGMTLTRVDEVNCEDGTDAILFYTDTGRVFKMYHSQDCCEDVHIESITGDLSDLVGSPITMAEKASNSDDPPLYPEWKHDSYTWTFYKFATIKGYVDIRWYGESNGYYGEEVDFVEMEVLK